MNEDELQKKREEAERKARRGEIDPTHEFTFLLIGQVRPRALFQKNQNKEFQKKIGNSFNNLYLFQLVGR